MRLTRLGRMWSPLDQSLGKIKISLLTGGKFSIWIWLQIAEMNLMADSGSKSSNLYQWSSHSATNHTEIGKPEYIARAPSPVPYILSLLSLPLSGNHHLRISWIS